MLNVFLALWNCTLWYSVHNSQDVNSNTQGSPLYKTYATVRGGHAIEDNYMIFHYSGEKTKI